MKNVIQKRMTIAKKVLGAAAALLFLALMIPNCAVRVPASGGPHLNRTKITVFTDGKAVLKVRGYKKKVKWSVKGKRLITVRAKGAKRQSAVLVPTGKTGSCFVTAKAGKTSLRCRVTVKKRPGQGEDNSGKRAAFEDEDDPHGGSGKDREDSPLESGLPGSLEAAAVSDAGDAVSITLNAVPDSEAGSSVTVSKSGDGEYTSLTRALYETGEDVVVKAGTYDLVEEYRAYFGSGIFDTMSDRTEGMNLFQYGLIINNRTVRFLKGAVVVCDLAGTKYGALVDGNHRFSPFNLGSNAVLDGLTCHATGTWYLIHDDFGDESAYYTNIIKNCTLTMTRPGNRNVIGGGTRPHSTSIISGCCLDNGLSKQSETVRYHNCDYPGAAPSVLIENCRVNGFIGARYYGAQKNPKMTFTVTGCTTGSGIKKTAESPKYSVDNVVLKLRGNVTAP